MMRSIKTIKEPSSILYLSIPLLMLVVGVVFPLARLGSFVKVGYIVFFVHVLLLFPFMQLLSIRNAPLQMRGLRGFLLVELGVQVLVFVLLVTEWKASIIGFGLALLLIELGALALPSVWKDGKKVLVRDWQSETFLPRKITGTSGNITLLLVMTIQVLVCIGAGFFIIFSSGKTVSIGDAFFRWDGLSTQPNEALSNPFPAIVRPTYILAQPNQKANKLAPLEQTEYVLKLHNNLVSTEEKLAYYYVMTVGFRQDIVVGWVDKKSVDDSFPRVQHTYDMPDFYPLLLYGVTAFNITWVKEGVLDGVIGFLIAILLLMFSDRWKERIGWVISVFSLCVALVRFSPGFALTGPGATFWLLAYVITPRLFLIPSGVGLLLLRLARLVGIKRLSREDVVVNI